MGRDRRSASCSLAETRGTSGGLAGGPAPVWVLRRALSVRGALSETLGRWHRDMNVCSPNLASVLVKSCGMGWIKLLIDNNVFWVINKIRK